MSHGIDLFYFQLGGPTKCGNEDLPKNFTCSTNEEISGSITLCGKPQPTISWMFGDQSFNGTVNLTKADQHQYTYSLICVEKIFLIKPQDFIMSLVHLWFSWKTVSLQFHIISNSTLVYCERFLRRICVVESRVIKSSDDLSQHLEKLLQIKFYFHC